MWKLKNNQPTRSEWFSGLLWAELLFSRLSARDAAFAIRRRIGVTLTVCTDFERGVVDYLEHRETTLKIQQVKVAP